jgi:hypothetical protein
MIASGRMEHGSNDYDLLFFDRLINHTIWESLRITPSDVLGRMPTAVQKRSYGKEIKHFQDLFHELITETGTLSVIPLRRFNYIVSGARPNNDLPPHDFGRDRKRSFIASSDTDELGLE